MASGAISRTSSLAHFYDRRNIFVEFLSTMVSGGHHDRWSKVANFPSYFANLENGTANKLRYISRTRTRVRVVSIDRSRIFSVFPFKSYAYVSLNVKIYNRICRLACVILLRIPQPHYETTFLRKFVHSFPSARQYTIQECLCVFFSVIRDPVIHLSLLWAKNYQVY